MTMINTITGSAALDAVCAGMLNAGVAGAIASGTTTDTVAAFWHSISGDADLTKATASAAVYEQVLTLYGNAVAADSGAVAATDSVKAYVAGL